MEARSAARTSGSADGTRDAPLGSDIEFLALKAFARGTRLLNERLRSLDLRARSYSVLAMSCTAAPPTQRELAALLELDPSQIVPLVDDLVARGLVVRERDERDQRTRIVRALPSGQALFATARRIAEESEVEALAPLTSAQRDQLRALLRTIVFDR